MDRRLAERSFTHMHVIPNIEPRGLRALHYLLLALPRNQGRACVNHSTAQTQYHHPQALVVPTEITGFALLCLALP